MLIASLRKTESRNVCSRVPLYWQSPAAIGGQSKSLATLSQIPVLGKPQNCWPGMRLILLGLRDMFLGAKLPLSFKEVQSS